MIGLYHLVKNDLFNIANRLKAIDKDYFVVYSYRDNRYEVHSRGNRGNTFCFAADSLDERVLVKARKTRRERLQKLLEEMESHNRALLDKFKLDTVKNIELGAEKALSKGGKE